MGIFILFIFLAFSLQAIVNSQIETYGENTALTCMNTVDFPEVLEKSRSFMTDNCTGKSELKMYNYGLYWFSPYATAAYMRCDQFNEPSQCLLFKNCYWDISTGWFITTGKCRANVSEYGEENVNLTHYGWGHSNRSGFETFDTFANSVDICDGQYNGLEKSREVCEQFDCTWNNATLFGIRNAEKAGISFWQMMGWMLSFEIDLCWGWFNIIPSILMWIMLIAFLICVILIFLPG